MTITPSERLARIRAVQEAAARQAEQEAGRSSSIVPQLQEAVKRISARLKALEDEYLRNINMTAAELAELAWLEKDYDDTERQGDWVP
jgi:hypothetical protein